MSPSECVVRYYILGARLLFASLLLCSGGLSKAQEWQTGSGFRFKRLTVPPSGKTGFSLLPASATGIGFSNVLPQTVSITNQILLDGSGVAAGDIDGDGWCDLYFCAIDGRNTLYRNQGNWKFEDITEQAGVGCTGLRSTGAVFADLNGDGKLDLIVNTAGNGTHIFYNSGHGHFTPASTVYNQNRGGKSLAVGDIDGDGYLDVYVVNYRRAALMDEPNGARFTFKMVDGKQTIATFNGRPLAGSEMADRFAIGPQGDFQENGEPDVLYRNVGGTNLVPVPFTEGNFLDEDGAPLKKAPLDWGLSAMFRDINGDGLPDLYVCNDFQTPDRFWINQGGGKFRLLPRLAQRKSSISSMAVDFADLNRDGYDDFFVVDMMSREHAQRMRVPAIRYPPNPAAIGEIEDRPQYEANTLFLNRGDGTFAEIGQLSGVEASEWTWSCAFMDVDLDGWEDILIANGIERDGRDLDVSTRFKQMRSGRQPSAAEVLLMRGTFPRQANGNVAFRNRGDLTFEEVGKKWGFDWKGVSSGMVLADLDNDGDLDVVINTLNGPALIYRNETSSHRVSVRLKGRGPNTHGIGARIAVSGGAVPVQAQEMVCGGRYLSGDDTLRAFAAGAAKKLDIEVAWRSGRYSVVTNALPDCEYEVDEGFAQEMQPGSARKRLDGVGLAQQKTARSPLFEDVSRTLEAVHHEDPFDDFQRQPLLPNKLSQLGPGVAWFDVDGDGWEDLIVASGKGGQIGIYQNRSTNGFKRLQDPPFSGSIARDQTTVLGLRLATNREVLLAGCANYEDGPANGPGPAVRQYNLTDGSAQDLLVTNAASTGPLALAELDGKGHLELFVGGRVIPGRYPEAASSEIYRRDGDRWVPDFDNTQALQKVGLVSGAVFTDLDGDGYAELVLACEWGSIHIFHNQGGKLVPWDSPLTWPTDPGTNQMPRTIGSLRGWWNSVAAGDFDGDGRMDLVAGNWGRNTKYESHRARPLALYYGDFQAEGSVQLIEAHWEPALQKWVPERPLDSLAAHLPWLRGRFATYQAFGVASVDEVLGDRLSGANRLEVNCLESVVLLNRGDHFEVRPLPMEAQMTPAFGICIGDLDGDGKEDVFLAQNFFATQPATPRYDAGRGLLLQGNGQGGFRAMPGQESGIKVYGEQRGAALCDFDHDGRADLVVAQNGAQIRLLRNAGATPGLRVRLLGPAGNLDAIGAVIRLKEGSAWGPAREVHSGSGYWSQDSVTQVFGTPKPAMEIQVRWPGGKLTMQSIPAGAREIVVSENTLSMTK